MIEALHITPMANLHSILKEGIIRTRPLLDNHLEGFKKIAEIQDDCVSYFIIPTNTKTIKYVKDTIYWKIWGTPRNKIAIELNSDDISLWKYHFKELRHESSAFVVLKCLLDFDKTFQVFHHQSGAMEGFGDMDDRYAHDRLLLGISYKDKIDTKNIEVLDICHSEIKRSKINIFTSRL